MLQQTGCSAHVQRFMLPSWIRQFKHRNYMHEHERQEHPSSSTARLVLASTNCPSSMCCPCCPSSGEIVPGIPLKYDPLHMAPAVPAPAAADAQARERMLHRHQDLMRLYSASTRRSNSVATETSSIAAPNDCNVSQNDLAVLKSKFQFIRDDEADATHGETDWQIRMSVRYYRQLFREYALADLSRYKEGKIGLRWRTESEVVAGKGQFSCGNKRCDERVGLRSYELLFAYVEHGERKRCLVKVRACSSCAEKMFYKKLLEVRRKNERKKEKRERKRRRMEKRNGRGGKLKAKRRRRSASCSDSSSSGVSDGQLEQHEAEEDTAGQDTGDIHELCARINAEQKAGYPSMTSQRKEEARGSEKCCDELDELLP